MPLIPRILYTVGVGLGLGWTLPCLSQMTTVGEHARPPGIASRAFGVTSTTRELPSVLMIRAQVMPACLVSMASGGSPFVRCTGGIDWQADLGFGAQAHPQVGTAAAALSSATCGEGASTIPCLIVEF